MPVHFSFFIGRNKNLSGPLIASLHKFIERNIPFSQADTDPVYTITEGYPENGIDVCQFYYKLCVQAFVTDTTGKSLTQFQLHIDYEDPIAGNVLGDCTSTLGNLVNLIKDVIKNPNWHTNTFSPCSIPSDLDWHLSSLGGGAGGDYSLTGEACGNFTAAAKALQASCEDERAFWVQDNMGIIVISSILAFVALCITVGCSIHAIQKCRNRMRNEEQEPENMFAALADPDADEKEVAEEEKINLDCNDDTGEAKLKI